MMSEPLPPVTVLPLAPVASDAPGWQPPFAITGQGDIPPVMGVYALVCVLNGARYVGASLNCRKRVADHVAELQRGRHRTRHLQNAWRKYGAGTFRAVLLEAVTGTYEDLHDREEYYITQTPPKLLLNSAPHAVGTYYGIPGYRFTPEQRAKVSAAGMGRPGSPRLRAVTSERNRTREWTTEQRAVVSDRFRGKPLSPEHAANAGATHRGRKCSPQHVATMSERAKRQWADPNSVIRSAVEGRTVTPEHRAKLSQQATLRELRRAIVRRDAQIARLQAEQEEVET